MINLCKCCDEKEATFRIRFVDETLSVCASCVAVAFTEEVENVISVRKI